MKSQEAAAHGHANGAARTQWIEIARRVKDGVSGLPSTLGDRMKQDPFTTLGIAAVAGVGVGILLGSRILRTAVTSAVSYAVVEFVRAYVGERMPSADGVHLPHVAEAPRAPHASHS